MASAKILCKSWKQSEMELSSSLMRQWDPDWDGEWMSAKMFHHIHFNTHNFGFTFIVLSFPFMAGIWKLWNEFLPCVIWSWPDLIIHTSAILMIWRARRWYLVWVPLSFDHILIEEQRRRLLNGINQRTWKIVSIRENFHASFSEGNSQWI